MIGKWRCLSCAATGRTYGVWMDGQRTYACGYDWFISSKEMWQKLEQNKIKNALDPANFAHKGLWKIIVYHEGSVALICGQGMEEVVYRR
jgi:hypothetical protein